LLAICIIKV